MIENKDKGETVQVKGIQVEVTYSFDDAFRKFRLLTQKEKILTEYKQRMSYESPSQKNKRKHREAQERFLEESKRERMMLSGEWEKLQKRKAEKKAKKQETRRLNRESNEQQQF